MKSKTIYFVAGEASADNHGAALMRALRNHDADLDFIGCGGPQMKAVAGARFKNWIEKSGVLGLWEVIKHYGYFRKQFHETLEEIKESKPDAVVLIDYPGFNLRLARALHSTSAKATADKRQITERKIIYYISPQVWAWNRGRIKKMARWLDLMLCIFPFEAELYNQSGLRTIFVGHPMIERLGARKSGRRGDTDSSGGEIDVKRNRDLIGLFPGSRLREVRKIFPILIETGRELRRQKSNLRFEIAAASHELALEMEKMLDRHGEDGHLFEIKTGDAVGLMQRAFAGIVASGSATLEAAYFRLPFVLIYKVSWMTYLAGRLLVKVKFLGMPNVLANKQVVPEFIQHRARPLALAKAISRLMDESSVRQQMISEFDKIMGQLAEGGASEKAAKAILDEIR